MKQLSFNNDSNLKAELVAMAKHHADADMLLKGTFGKQSDSGFRGCSVGCFAHDINPKSAQYHKVLAEKAGLPLWLIHTQDFLFERLENPTEFHVEFFQRIPVGVNLQPVLHKITIDRMQRLLDVQSKAPDSIYKKQVCDAIAQVKALYEKYPDFSSEEAKRDAESAAKSAAFAAFAAFAAIAALAESAKSAESAAFAAFAASAEYAESAESAKSAAFAEYAALAAYAAFAKSAAIAALAESAKSAALAEYAESAKSAKSADEELKSLYKAFEEVTK